MSANVQDRAATLTWRHDWTARLARAETDLGLTAGTLTITGATVAGPTSATITGTAHTGTAVTFTLATTGITTAQDIRLTTTVTLSNGDTDVDDVVITVTDT